MDSNISSGIIAAIMGALSSVLTTYVKNFNETKKEKIAELKLINHEHFNHLRLYLAETYYSLSDIQDRIENEGGRCSDLLVAHEAQVISDQEDYWFINDGCFLISTCYLTACLFYHIQKMRDNFPYLRLNSNDDSSLISLMIKVNNCFNSNLGIYYLIQPSIGIDMYLTAEKRLLTYREFCLLLKNPSSRIWFDRLIDFYISTGLGEHPDRIDNLIKSIDELSKCIERFIGSNSAIEAMMTKTLILAQRSSK